MQSLASKKNEVFSISEEETKVQEFLGSKRIAWNFLWSDKDGKIKELKTSIEIDPRVITIGSAATSVGHSRFVVQEPRQRSEREY